MGKIKARKKRKPRIKAIEHRVDNITIEFKQKGNKRRLLRVQRYKKPVIIKDVDLTRNPDKITFLVFVNKYGDRFEMFSYKNNPEKAFISLNSEVIGLNKFDWRRLQSALMKTGKYLGLLK